MKNTQDKFYAALDIGTNSFHMIVARLNKRGRLKIVDRAREVIRLGTENSSAEKLISPNEIKRSIDILNNFKNLVKLYNAELMSAATSAVRESKNKEEFCSEILKNTGINIRIITGREEAELIFNGIKNDVDISKNKVLCIDIGGGSTELIAADRGQIQYSESFDMGAVKLTKKFFPDYNLDEKRIEDCRQYVRREILNDKKISKGEKFDYLVGSSGTIEASEEMINFQSGPDPASTDNNKRNISENENHPSFDYADYKKLVTKILSAETIEDRLKIQGMETKRADIIQSGIIILDEVFEMFNVRKMVVSKYALREGIIYNLINE